MSTQGSFKPLSEKTDALFVKSINKFPNTATKWMSADFQIAYDPCTCKYGSFLNLNVQLFQTSNLELQVRSTSLNMNLVNGGVQNYDAHFLTNFTTEEEPGEVIYKKLDYLFEDYSSQYATYESNLDRYQAYNSGVKAQVLDLARKYIVDGITSAVPAGATADWIIKNGLDFGEKKANLEDGFQTGAKSILQEGYDLLSVALVGKKPQKPIVPTMPVVTISEGVIKGDIINGVPLEGPKFYAPGTYAFGQLGYDLTNPSQSLGSLSDENYPLYNEVLGTFALLKYPTITTKRETEVEQVFGYSYPNGVFGTMAILNFVHELKIEDLEYTFNPALDIDYEKTKLFAQLIFEIDNNMSQDPFFGSHYTEVSTYNPVNNPPNPAFDLGFKNMTDPLHFLRDYLSTEPVIVGGKLIDGNSDGTVLMKTDMVPIDALEKCNFKYYSSPETRFFIELNQSSSQMEQIVDDYFKLGVLNVKIKLMVDFYYNQIGSNGEQVNVTQVFTYDIPDYNVKENVDTTFDYQHDFSANISGNKVYGNIIFDENHPDVYQLVGNKIFVAGSHITINGNIEVVAGKELIIHALNDIVIDPSTEIGENITIGTYEPVYKSVPNDPEMRTSFFDSYCKGKDKVYQANIASKRAIETQKQMDDVKKDIEFETMYSLYPNPTSYKTILNIQTDQGGIYDIWMTDITGKEVMSLKSIELPQAGNHNLEIETGSLHGGIYLVNIRNNSQVVIKKLMVIN